MRVFFVVVCSCLWATVCAADTPAIVAPDAVLTPAAIAMADVYPVIRSRDQIDDLTGGQPVSAPLAGDLMITYEVGFTAPRVILTKQAAADAGLDQAALHTRAMGNLLAHSNEAMISGSDAGLYFLALDGKTENALLLDQGLWDAVTDQVGPIIMTIPAPELVFFVPQFDAAAFDIMIDVRDNVIAERGSDLTDNLFTWNDGHWVVLPQ